MIHTIRPVISVLLILWFLDSPGQETTVEQMPNIILIMADDLGTEAVGCYGSTSYATPVLDQLAAEGARFNHAYSYPLCTPTRVSLMTGKYNFRNWKAFGILDPEEPTFGHMMKKQGYKTCMVGKWQLQSYDPPGYPGSDLRRNTGMKVENAGFDEYCMWHVGHTEDKGSRYSDPIIYQNGTFRKNTNGKYGPDIFTDYLNGFIKENYDKPFFAYYPMALTHGPFVPTPDSEVWKDRTLRHKNDPKYFGDMVGYMDQLVGSIVATLDEVGIRENTLIIFYSDNGTHTKITSQMGDKMVQGGKGKTIDAGTRVPMIAHWKGTIAPQVSEQMVAPCDFVPTLYNVLGRKVPNTVFTDGESFLPQLLGRQTNQRNWVLVDHNPRPGWDKENLIPRRFVRGHQYKLYDDGRFYDVENDELEQNPLSVNKPALRLIKRKYQGILDSLRRYRTFGEFKSFDPQFHQIVPEHAKIEVLAEGFTWTEGPVWIEREQCLLFSDVPRNTVYKWSEMNGLEIFLENSGYTGGTRRSGGKGSNGLAVDMNGNLLLCRQGDQEVARLKSGYREPLPVFESLATHYEGKRFNSPNDLTVDKTGNIYFTDPSFRKKDASAESEALISGVYRINADGSIDLLVSDLPTPNGIALSPNEDILYIANSNPPKWMSYEFDQSGKLKKGEVLYDGQKLVDESLSKQKPDGMAVNKEGTLFAAGPEGILVFSPEGVHLGTIYTGKKTSNCVLSSDEKTLFATVDDYVVRIVLGYQLGL